MYSSYSEPVVIFLQPECMVLIDLHTVTKTLVCHLIDHKVREICNNNNNFQILFQGTLRHNYNLATDLSQKQMYP